MEDNNQDAKQLKKEAKREARIEAKRRKLAEQRAARLAQSTSSQQDIETSAAAPQNALQNADMDVNEPGHDNGSSTARPVTADSANRERHIDLSKAGDVLVQAPDAAAETAAAQETVSVPVSVSAPAVENGGSDASGRLRRIMARMKKISPAYAVKCIVALVVLIGIVYAALEIADYKDKKTDVFITDEGFKHASAFEDCVPLIGIDVSVHQKGDIDWKKVKTSGVDFVFVRAGYRAADNGTLHADENFDKNVRNAQKAGLMVGAYFYSQALTPGEGKEEAEFVLNMLKGYKMTMPVAIDYEIYKDGRLDQKIQAGELYAASFYHDIVLGFTNTVEAAGYESVVYANWDMLNNYMQADLIDDMATIWLSRFDKEADLDAEYWFWQCSEEAKAGGIQSKVDQDFWYIKPGKVYPTRAKHKKNAVSVGDCTIKFKDDSCMLRNFRAEPKFKMAYNGKNMKEGRDYYSSVVHNTKEGTGYVIIRGIGKYKDWIMHPFKIE